MKVQALLNSVFIKPLVLGDDGKHTHEPSTPTVNVRAIQLGRRSGAVGGRRRHKDRKPPPVDAAKRSWSHGKVLTGTAAFATISHIIQL